MEGRATTCDTSVTPIPANSRCETGQIRPSHPGGLPLLEEDQSRKEELRRYKEGKDRERRWDAVGSRSMKRVVCRETEC